MTGPLDASRIVDLDRLVTNVSGSEELAKIVIDEFLLHASSQLAGLRDAVASGDLERVRTAAHLYKGSLGAIYANAAWQELKALELAARAGDATSVQACFARAQEASVELESTLERWRVAR